MFLSLRLSNGGEYLFQAQNDDELSQWIDSINNASGDEGGAAGGAERSQTLPEGQKLPKEKKPFFTLKGSGSGKQK